MAYTLTGSRHIGTGALPPPIVGFDAVDTSTGNMYVANSGGTAWTLIGNVNNTYLGALPISGGTMTGAINGANGWAPNDSPNFTTSAKLNGMNLATTSDLSTTSTTILNSIAPKITEAVASTASGLSVKQNIAMASGILTFTNLTPQTIPLPTYPDGSVADESDCTWVMGLVYGYWPCGRSDANGDTFVGEGAPISSSSRTIQYCLKDNGGNFYQTRFWYMIIGVRS